MEEIKTFPVRSPFEHKLTGSRAIKVNEGDPCTFPSFLRNCITAISSMIQNLTQLYGKALLIDLSKIKKFAFQAS